MTIELRNAAPRDAEHVARLADMSGEGLPLTLWARRTDPGEGPLDVGRAEALAEGSYFDWRKTTIAEEDGVIAGMVTSHLTGEDPAPIDGDTHPVLRPLIKLVNMAPRTRLINALAVYPAYQRHGVADSLMDAVEAEPGQAGVSLIVGDRNDQARQFLTARGYAEKKVVPLIRADWVTENASWILMVKDSR